MKRFMILFAGLLCLFVAAGLLLPAFAKLTEFGRMPKEALVSYTAGILLAACGIVTLLKGTFLKRRVEK